ncbi:hypothetical protein [Ottowia flava]|uniref:hypothetical protein n=1 Tax=Ottowia flava TaxID=2675430 RepID=UPI0016507CBA
MDGSALWVALQVRLSSAYRDIGEYPQRQETEHFPGAEDQKKQIDPKKYQDQPGDEGHRIGHCHTEFIGASGGRRISKSRSPLTKF